MATSRQLNTSRNPIMRPPSYRQRLFLEHDLGESSGAAVDAARRAGYSTPHLIGVNMLRHATFRRLLRAFYPHPANKSALRAEGTSHFRASGKRGWPPTSLSQLLVGMNQLQISCPQISQMNADGENHRDDALLVRLADSSIFEVAIRLSLGFSRLTDRPEGGNQAPDHLSSRSEQVVRASPRLSPGNDRH